MNETKFGSEFYRWFEVLENKKKFSTGALEFKSLKGNTFNVKQWKKIQGNQVGYLLDAMSENGVYHKISDQAQGNKKFDSFFLKNSKSYLILYFQKQKNFFILDMKNFPKNVDSISYDYCKENYETQKLLKKDNNIKIYNI